MLNRIRDARRAKGMTLSDVAAACHPPTTAQTIGRLETGMRTLSLGWLNRIAAALGVDASELVDLPDQASITLAATLDRDGAHAPRNSEAIPAPRIGGNQVAMRVTGGTGDYRSGDEIWLDTLPPDSFAAALNRDVLVPKSGGRFVFGRLINMEERRLQVLPPGHGSRQQVVVDAPWLAVAVRLIRRL